MRAWLKSCLFLALCLACVPATTAHASTIDSNATQERGNLSPALEDALDQLTQATSATVAPSPQAIDEVLRFLFTTEPKDLKKIEPKSRPSGAGVLYTDSVKVSLRTLMDYTLDTGIPGEAIYPTSVRRNDWRQGSEVLAKSATFLNSPLPPAEPLAMRGVEEEETTPDTSSGCHYSYALNRLFILAGYEGKSALFSISMLPKESGVGLKGLIVGDDGNWDYVYTNKPGTNITMLGWAETHLYGSASVTVFVGDESTPVTNIYSFKWAKAGWSGSNVVKPSHITAGIKRFVDGVSTVLESPKRPTPNAIKARMAELNAMSDDALRAEAAPLAASLEANPALKDADYKTAVRENYPASMNREQLLAELIKVFMRDAIIGKK